MIISLGNRRATVKLGRLLGESLPAGTAVLLEGGLGAGKTTLVQGIGAGLGIPETDLISPTFTLVHEYYGGRLPLYHLDLYRLQTTEIESINPEIYWDSLEVTPGITAIEWASRLPYQPNNFIKIDLSTTGEGRQANLHQCPILDWQLDETKLNL